MKIGKSKNARGSTVLELVVILAIIILFAGLLVPEIRNYIAESRKAKFLALYQKLADAAMKYWADTGQYPIEDSRSTDQDDHQLFYKPNPFIPGWSGPYIDRPLTPDQNPYDTDGVGGPDPIILCNSLDQLPDGTPPDNASGFDLDGTGPATALTGPGSRLYIQRTPPSVGSFPGPYMDMNGFDRIFEDFFDPAVPGAGYDYGTSVGQRSSTGRMELNSIFIFTMD